ARQADATVGPGLSRHPFDEVVAVLGLLLTPERNVALAAVDAAAVGIEHGIAVGAPISGIRALEFLQTGQDFLRNPSSEREVVQEQRAAALAIGAPGDDGRQIFPAYGAKNISVDAYTVAQTQFDIALRKDVAIERAATFDADGTLLQHLLSRGEA